MLSPVWFCVITYISISKLAICKIIKIFNLLVRVHFKKQNKGRIKSPFKNSCIALRGFSGCLKSTFIVVICCLGPAANSFFQGMTSGLSHWKLKVILSCWKDVPGFLGQHLLLFFQCQASAERKAQLTTVITSKLLILLWL